MGNIVEGERIPEVAGGGRMAESQENKALVPYLLERQLRMTQERLQRRDSREGGALH